MQTKLIQQLHKYTNFLSNEFYLTPILSIYSLVIKPLKSFNFLPINHNVLQKSHPVPSGLCPIRFISDGFSPNPVISNITESHSIDALSGLFVILSR